MKPLFLASHPAIDFLNTALAPDGVATELIGDGRAFLDWLVAAGLLDAAEAARLARHLGTAGLDAAAADARRLRERMRAAIRRWQEEGAVDAGDLRQLNARLERATFRRELAASGLLERPVSEDLVARVALTIAELIAREDASRIRSCAGEGCTLWFLDRTRGGRRRFCSATACGNRAKVAAFRARLQRPR